jgi:hypothetical protein
LIKDGPLQIAAQPEAIAPPSSVSQQVAPLNESEDDPFWRSTQSLLNEIKKAYSLILQEKEEQILQLKEEVADLKTLVRVLEDDNNRLKKLPKDLSVASSGADSLDFDLGLEA